MLSNPQMVMLINICFSLIWNNQNSKVLKQVAKPLVMILKEGNCIF